MGCPLMKLVGSAPPSPPQATAGVLRKPPLRHTAFWRQMLAPGAPLLPTTEPHLIFLLKEHFQDLLCEKEKIETPKHHCRLGNVMILQRVETEGL